MRITTWLIVQIAHQCMSSIMSLTRAPYKRKRKSKNKLSLHEDDDDAVDTVTHVQVDVNTKSGPKTKCIKVPLTAVMEEQQTSNSSILDDPNLGPECDMQEPQVDDEPIRPHIGMVSF